MRNFRCLPTKEREENIIFERRKKSILKDFCITTIVPMTIVLTTIMLTTIVITTITLTTIVPITIVLTTIMLKQLF